MKSIKNCSLIMVNAEKSKSKIAKLIAYYTKGKYSHVAVYFDGNIIESAITMDRNYNIYNGVNINNELKGDIFEFLGPLTKKKLEKAREFIKSTEFKKYNLIKLFLEIFIYPTRKFWNFIGWVPFSKICYGYECANWADAFFKSMGFDIFPGLNENLTVPNDFANAKLFKLVGDNYNDSKDKI